MKNWFGWLISTASGLVLWSYANWVQGTQEPWDGPDYWTTFLPLAVGLSFVVGFIFPEKPWRWPLAIMLAQVPVMLIATNQSPTFLVLGLGLLVAFSLPGMLASKLGAIARHWVDREKPA